MPNMINFKIVTPRHIIIVFQNIRGKDKVLKSFREKKTDLTQRIQNQYGIELHNTTVTFNTDTES